MTYDTYSDLKFFFLYISNLSLKFGETIRKYFGLVAKIVLEISINFIP